MDGGHDAVRGLGLRLAATALNQRALSLFGPRLPRLVGGWMPWLALRRYAPRPLPGPDWLRARPILAGICGTDMALLTGRASPIMSPFASFPAVLGHEVVAEVVETGAGVRGLAAGERIVVDPVVSCAVRGLDACRECRDGHPATCLRSADGPLAPGLILGYCSDLPGGWGDEVLVHATQAHRVPADLSDEQAVLVEPLSVALHAVIRDPPAPGDRVLVIGGGTLGLLTSAALRLAGGAAVPTVTARQAAQARMAERLGAGATIAASAARVDEEAGRHSGARTYRSLLGDLVLDDGFDLVYDCVGTRVSLEQALRLAAPRGRIVLLGGPGRIGPLDWTLAWVRERRIQGTYVYATEPSMAGAPHTFEVAMRAMVEHPDLPIGELVTHRFGLERWRDAMRANLRRSASSALKTVFEVTPRTA